MTDIAEGQSGADPKMLRALQGLLAKLGVSGQTVMSADNLTKYVIHALAKKYKVDDEDVAGALSSQGKSLRTVISAANTYDRTLKALEKFAPDLPAPSIPGKGALSADEVWRETGWKSVKGGGKVWSRPPNVKLSEWFPPRFSRYIADYNLNTDVAAASSAIASDSPMLPVTMEQAKEFRRQDEMWDRIDNARGKANARQTKMTFDADERERQRRENVRVEMMDEHDRFIYENTDRFGKGGAEQVFRQRLLKELPPFFKDSKLSTKTLIGIQKTIASARGIPLVGRLMHPAALGFAALGLTDAYLRASSAANKEVTGWSTSRAITGSPSRKFDRMARLAGADDEASVLKLYSALLEKFGTEDAFVPIGQMLRGTPKGIARLSVAKSQGLDDKMTNLLMYMAGEEPIGSTKEAQGTAARESRLRDIQKWGLRSGSSFIEKLRGASLWIWGEKALEARGTSWMDLIEGAAGPSGWGNLIMRKILHPSDRIDEAIERQIESESAAESYDQYDSSGGSTTNNSVSNNSHAVYINRVDVNTDNPEDFIRNMEGIAERTSGSHANILNSMDSRVMV